MAKSGQIHWQKAQVVQVPSDFRRGGMYPRELNSPEDSRTCWGQNSMQKLHPLHISGSIIRSPFKVLLLTNFAFLVLGSDCFNFGLLKLSQILMNCLG